MAISTLVVNDRRSLSQNSSEPEPAQAAPGQNQTGQNQTGQNQTGQNQTGGRMSEDEEELKVERTADGSDTVVSGRFGATYHSTFGALEESRHVYLLAGLRHWLATGSHQRPLAREVSVLEVGLGTGLNVLLTYLDWAKQIHVKKSQAKEVEAKEVEAKEAEDKEAEDKEAEDKEGQQEARSWRVRYLAVEPYPLPEATWQQLNYPQMLSSWENGSQEGPGELSEVFRRIQTLPAEEPLLLGDGFHFSWKRCLLQQLEQVTNPADWFDVVYFDAFGPKSQPEMWTLKSLQVVRNVLRPGGVLVTFSASGQFRRNLKALEFAVENPPGPPGKRQMTRATLALEKNLPGGEAFPVLNPSS